MTDRHWTTIAVLAVTAAVSVATLLPLLAQGWLLAAVILFVVVGFAVFSILKIRRAEPDAARAIMNAGLLTIMLVVGLTALRINQLDDELDKAATDRVTSQP